MALINFIYMYAFWVVLPVLCIMAWHMGGKPEQQAAAMCLLAAAASLLTRTKASYIHLEQMLFGIDVLLLFGFIWLVLTTDRAWLMPAAALQAISCLSHLAKLFEPRSGWLGYQLMAEASGYPVIMLLAIGIRSHRRSVRLRALAISARSSSARAADRRTAPPDS